MWRNWTNEVCAASGRSNKPNEGAEKRSVAIGNERNDYFSNGSAADNCDLHFNLITRCGAIGSALALGARCCRFESCHFDQKGSGINVPEPFLNI